MSEYNISTVYYSDHSAMSSVRKLLNEEGIRLDENLDYTCAMYDDSDIVATGSCYKNTLRCMAVSHKHQGEGLMNEIMSHLINIQFDRGNTHLFLYTKCTSSRYFSDLGFHEIIRIDGEIVFMENSRNGFSQYLQELKQQYIPGHSVAAIVMNANPFTLGHRYLIEKASAENDVVHLFAVSEDASLIPYSVRRKLIEDGTRDLPNIHIHDSGPYIISNATFPSYFQKDKVSVIRGHALLDLTIFTKIANVLGITRRYVGEESRSLVTGIYNEIMQLQLPKHGIECLVIPRKKINGEIISASSVRLAIQENNLTVLRSMVPVTTYHYFTSSEAKPVIDKIRNSNLVVHY
jgi:[citrate (pro-3S)-lyase] ligase